MAAIITSKMRFNISNKFRECIEQDLADEKYYIFIGKPEAWGPNLPNDDLFPDTPVDSLQAEYRIWDGIMGMKKVLPNQTSFVTPRYNWDTTGDTIYVQYIDNDALLFNHPTDQEINDANVAGNYTPGSFYVINSIFQVFKCLSNNNDSKSTEEPVAIETNPLPIIETADGYQWKYMFTIGTADALKFLTDHWMPVKVLDANDGSAQWTVQQGATNGIINTINIVSQGIGYSNVISTEETVQNATTNTITLHAGASSTLDFYTNNTVWIESGPGVGESKVITTYDGVTKIATLDSSWNVLPIGGSSTFKVLPTVSITGNGTGARAKAIVDEITPNEILNVIVVDGGSDYTYIDASIIGANGTGAEIVAVLPSQGGHGSDPVRELGGYFVMINTRLEFNEGDGDFPISNDYRQIGLIKNPFDYNTTDISTALTRIASQRVLVDIPSGTFNTDELISSNGTTGFLVEILDYDINPAQKILVFTQNSTTGYDDFSLEIGNAITGDSTGTTAQILQILDPEVEKYTGDVLYYENRRPVLRAPDQLEDIKIIIQF